MTVSINLAGEIIVVEANSSIGLYELPGKRAPFR